METQQKGGTGKPRTAQSKDTKSNPTLAEIVTEFTRAMLAAGIETDAHIDADGCLHRVHVVGHRHGTKNAAYILHMDGCPAGWYQNFVSGITGTWRLDGGKWEMDHATRRKIEEGRKQRQWEMDQRHAKKAAEACRIWNSAAPCTDHPYMTRKGIKPHGLRVGTWRKWIEGETGWKQITIENVLFVPVVSPDGQLVNVQGILPEPHPALGRDKDFNGGRKKSCCFWIGQPTNTVMIAEGYATAASLHEHTGHMAVVAFDCGNLLDVAQVIRANMPDATIIIASDNDRNTPGNPGLTKARSAALAIKGLLSVPKFPLDCNCTDWNDWYQFREAHTHG